MKFVVILDGRSVIGRIYQQGSNDGIAADEHPCLECVNVVTDSPYYLYAERSLSSAEDLIQKVFIPHSAVVSIHQFDDDGSIPQFGFTVK